MKSVFSKLILVALVAPLSALAAQPEGNQVPPDLGAKVAFTSTEGLVPLVALTLEDPRVQRKVMLNAQQLATSELIEELRQYQAGTPVEKQIEAIKISLATSQEQVAVKVAKAQLKRAQSSLTAEQAGNLRIYRGLIAASEGSFFGQGVSYDPAIYAADIVTDEAERTRNINAASRALVTSETDLALKLRELNGTAVQIKRFPSPGEETRLMAQMEKLGTKQGLEMAEASMLKTQVKLDRAILKNGRLLSQLEHLGESSLPLRRLIFWHGLPQVLSALALTDLGLQAYAYYKGRDPGISPLYTLTKNKVSASLK